MADFTNINNIYVKDGDLWDGIDYIKDKIDYDEVDYENRKSLRSDPTVQYFTNISGIYCKDVAGREELDELKALVDNIHWAPLEDGYSNFWFELTNDTLSPQLNFSAKNNDAVIDWGDGSGEQSLDTLTPTHTYSKAGKYIVKCKGVTGMGRQTPTSSSNLTPYVTVCKAIELSAEVAITETYAFRNMFGLEHFVSGAQSNIGRDTFSSCYNLKSVVMPLAGVVPISFLNSCQNLTDVTIGTTYTEIGQNAFNVCRKLQTFTIPSAVTNIDQGAFNGCSLLAEVHVQPTTPPTLGSNAFNSLPSDWVCYVPVGTAETYKAVAEWSTYADHIVEEGQTLSKAALNRIQLTEKNDTTELYEE